MIRRIMVLSGLFLYFTILQISCHNRGNEQQISLKTLPPIPIEKKGVEIFQFWEFKDDPLLWDINFVDPLALTVYKDSLRKILGTDTLQHRIQELAFQDTSYESVRTSNGDSINAQLIHKNAIGKIRPINYLEAQLLDYQISRYPLLGHPTKFHGFILSSDSLNLVKVYFAASDQPWPPRPGILLEKVTEDLKQGWIFKYHLHNHYEPRSNQYLGILAPSMTDAQFYKFLSEEYNLEEALITNGFHTVGIKRADFHKLKSNGND